MGFFDELKDEFAEDTAPVESKIGLADAGQAESIGELFDELGNASGLPGQAVGHESTQAAAPNGSEPKNVPADYTASGGKDGLSANNNKEQKIMEESSKDFIVSSLDDLELEEADDETANLTPGMKITGDIITSGSLDLAGSVVGNLRCAGKLVVTGSVSGNSIASEVFADNAQIRGNVTSTGTVKIGESSVIIGNICATSAVIAGAVKGDIDIKGPVILDSTSVVMGNIKSKSVQINNGAIIEGLCSQIYADVSPSSFFDELDSK